MIRQDGGPRAALSSLCTPDRLGKRLPMVLHCGENSLYEEPCLLAFDLFVGEVSRHAAAWLPAAVPATARLSLGAVLAFGLSPS